MKIRGIFAFNGNVADQSEVSKIISDMKLNYCVETGTLHGWTTAFFAERMKKVYSIEKIDETLEKARYHLDGYDNVELILGDSTYHLPRPLKEIPLDEKVLFYLDAHWHEHWPLFDELDIIGKYIGSRAVIIIDDFKVPNNGYVFDTYKGIENSFENIEPYLKNIYAKYDYRYLEGPLSFQLTYPQYHVNETEYKIYLDWFKDKINFTTGKILIYER